MPRVVAFLQPGMADWEAGPVLAGLRENFGAEVLTATPDGQPVTSIGGLRVAADAAFADVGPEDADAFLVIGSDRWPAYRDEGFLDLLRSVAASGKTLGAICGGTVPLARAGLFEGRAHTSNGRDWLQAQAGDYPGADLYRDTPAAVVDGALVTAPGTAPTTFAAAVFRRFAPEHEDAVQGFESMFSAELDALRSR